MSSSTNSPHEIDTLNFDEVGIRWTIRQAAGERVRFANLGAIQEALDIGELTLNDELTFDGNIWRTLSDIPDLRAFFWQVWKRASRGDLQADWMKTIGGNLDNLIGEDAPTTIATPDSALALVIQEALSRELMARSMEKLAPMVPDPGGVDAAPRPVETVAPPTPVPAVEAPGPAHPPEHAEPIPSDVPEILRAMGISLLLVSGALLLILSIP